MLCSLIAYDAAGNVVATLDYCVAKDADGNIVGLLDFEAHETAGGRLRDIWENDQAVGSGTWPEWIGGRAYDFRVELDPHPGPARARIMGLVHKGSGHRRERAQIEAAIAERIAQAKGEPADIRDLVGGPDRPLLIDANGRTQPREPTRRPNLPVIARKSRSEQ